MSRRERRLQIAKGAQEEKNSHSEGKSSNNNQKKYSKLIMFYDRNYAKLLIIPIVLLIASFVVIGIHFANTGDFINKAVSLEGGTTITIPTTQSVNVDNLEKALASEFYPAEIEVRSLSKAGKQTGIIIDTDLKEESEISSLLASTESKIGDLGEYNIEQMGSSLGASFYKETLISLILAFLFMGIVVFIYFRNFIPSVAVIAAAFSNIIITLAVVDLIGLKISTAGIAAFLMLIGYSVDTDILLTTRLIKRKDGTVLDRLLGAISTGFAMTATTLVVVTLTLIFSGLDTIRQIMTILLIGLLADLINTWIQNAGILRIYLAKKAKHE